jgi:hypothetical protein
VPGVYGGRSETLNEAVFVKSLEGAAVAAVEQLGSIKVVHAAAVVIAAAETAAVK